MRTLMIWACLAGAAFATQDPPRNEERKREGDAPKAVAGPCEVRVWLIDKEKKPVDLKEMAATLIVSDRQGGKKSHAMQAVTPKGEKAEWTARGETRDVPGTSYAAELVVWMPGEHRGKSDDRKADDRKSEDRKAEDKKADDSAWADRSGPYFKAELPKDAATAESEISVEFTIRGEKKTVAGWTSAPASRGGGWMKARERLAEMDRNLTAHDMTKGRATATELMTEMQAAFRGASVDSKKSESCLDACRDLQKHVEAGNRDKAFEAYRTCRDKFAELDAAHSPKDTDKDHRK